jgi:YbbR domain-containing protein
MQLSLPLTQVEMSGDLTLTEPPPESVLVVVTADGKSLLSNDWKDRGLRLVISQSRPGRFKGEISTDNIGLVKGERVNLTEIIAPREFNFNCDLIESREVPVINRYVTTPGEGFAIGKADSLVPSSVFITGPRSAVRIIDYIETESDSLTGVRNDFTMKIPLKYPDAYGISLLPDSVNLMVNVAPVKRVTMVDVPIEITETPRDLKFEYAPHYVDVRLRGRLDLVDTLKPENITAVADYRYIRDNGYIPVVVKLPDEVYSLGQTVDSIQILVHP